MRRHVLLFVGLMVGFLWTGALLNADASSRTVPAKYRGTFYQYIGHKKWDKLVIRKHSAQLSGSSYVKRFKLTPKAKSNAHKLAFKVTGKDKHQTFFTLNSKLKDEAGSPFPELGMSLASRKIKHKRYKVVRGFQAGYWFDFVKGHRVQHRYAGMANGKY